MIEKKVG